MLTTTTRGTALKNLNELLKDAEKCPRLTAWEDGFLARMRELVASAAGTMPTLSEAQQTALTRIEGKVYAT